MSAGTQARGDVGQFCCDCGAKLAEVWRARASVAPQCNPVRGFCVECANKRWPARAWVARPCVVCHRRVWTPAGARTPGRLACSDDCHTMARRVPARDVQGCEHCDRSFAPKRDGGLYCSPGCRVAAWRDTRAAELRWLHEERRKTARDSAHPGAPPRCECPRPWPRRDDDGDIGCARCAKRIDRVAELVAVVA